MDMASNLFIRLLYGCSVVVNSFVGVIFCSRFNRSSQCACFNWADASIYSKFGMIGLANWAMKRCQKYHAEPSSADHITPDPGVGSESHHKHTVWSRRSQPAGARRYSFTLAVTLGAGLEPHSCKHTYCYWSRDRSFLSNQTSWDNLDSVIIQPLSLEPSKVSVTMVTRTVQWDKDRGVPNVSDDIS